METGKIKWGKVIAAGLLAGLALNAIGWVGNALLLRAWWRAANSQVHLFRQRTFANELLTLLPDFVYGVALAWLYAVCLPRYGTGLRTSLRASFVVWLVGAMTTYLGIANAGLLPIGLSVATTTLALAAFIPAAWIVCQVYGDTQ